MKSQDDLVSGKLTPKFGLARFQVNTMNIENDVDKKIVCVNFLKFCLDNI